MSVAVAQGTQDTAIARSLFKEGVSFADAGDWVQAEDRFRRAYNVHPSPVIGFNWISALEQLGRLVEASELARRLQRNPEADDELKEAVSEKLALIEPRLGGVTVDVQGETEDVSVFLDDYELPRPAWGVETPVDPGEHQAKAKRDGETVSEASVSVAEGEVQTLLLEVLPPTPPPEVEAKPTPPPPPPEPERKPLYKNPWLWTAVGVVVVGGAVAGALAATSGGGTRSAPEGNTSPAVLEF